MQDLRVSPLAPIQSMGARSQKYFEEANQLGGIAAKARLASLAKVTSTEANASNDEAETLERLRTALAVVRVEYEGKAPPRLPNGREISQSGPLPGTEVLRLRRHIEATIDLISQRSSLFGDVTTTAQRINEAAAVVLEVARVSVWLLAEEGTKIRCIDLFDRKRNHHSAGTELLARDFAPYFAALSTERTIAAADAHTDTRTSCFSASYLKPLGIGALLDVPIWASGKMVGVICHEHVGTARLWTSDEERFSYLMSGLLSIALERPT